MWLRIFFIFFYFCITPSYKGSSIETHAVHVLHRGSLYSELVNVKQDLKTDSVSGIRDVYVDPWW